MNIIRSQERVKSSGEVFTPPELVNEMLDKLPPEIWSDPTKTFIDPAAGDGNFLVEVKKRLLEFHSEQHILENMIFAVDIMPDNIEVLQHRLGYLIDDQPNPILNKQNFDEEVLTHECFILDPDHNRTYRHHRNIVCADSLKYDFKHGFGRKEDGSDYTPDELKKNKQNENIVEIDSPSKVELAKEQKRQEEQEKTTEFKPVQGLLDF